ncbi:MAG: hypothetical protein J7466_15090 [Roseiflexus sp.]|jgi:hypothetical protein|nr:hypothetical protein [Roseiflexus sp.]
MASVLPGGNGRRPPRVLGKPGRERLPVRYVGLEETEPNRYIIVVVAPPSMVPTVSPGAAPPSRLPRRCLIANVGGRGCGHRGPMPR